MFNNALLVRRRIANERRNIHNITGNIVIEIRGRRKSLFDGDADHRLIGHERPLATTSPRTHTHIPVAVRFFL